MAERHVIARVDEKLRQRVYAHAQREGRTVSDVVRSALAASVGADDDQEEAVPA